MLVLSRHKNQKVNFPGLGITVEILEIKGSKVRVGIDAPIEVRILRDELPPNEFHDSADAAPHVVQLPRTLRHELRNTLHEVSLMLQVYEKRRTRSHRVDESDRVDPEQMFEAIVDRLEDLSQHRVFTSSGLLNTEPAPQGGKMGTALVVDDDDNERELLAGFLRMCDYHTEAAADGVQALAYLERQELPSVVLLDMHMPRCDGANFLRQLRAASKWNDLPVFVISGSTAQELGLRPDHGYTRWFNKPLNPRRIVEELGRIETRPPCVA